MQYNNTKVTPLLFRWIVAITTTCVLIYENLQKLRPKQRWKS